jgi:hypothetical protein
MRNQLMPNSNLATAEIRTHFAKVGKEGEMILEHYESNEFSLLCNMLASDGRPGPVIKVSTQRERERKKKQAKPTLLSLGGG